MPRSRTQPEVDFDFARYVATRRGFAERRARDGAAYAYVGERRVARSLAAARPVTLALEATGRLWKRVAKEKVLGSAVPVSHEQFPRLWEITVRCAEVLHIAVPTVYVAPTLDEESASTLGTDEEAYIVLSAKRIAPLTDDELAFVIGHECGHIHNNHAPFSTALHTLTTGTEFYVRWIVQPAVLALRAWARRAAITGDRAGLLCARNLDAAISALRTVAAGHRFLAKRIEALRLFAGSAYYRSFVGAGEGGLSAETCDAEVGALLRIF